MGSKPISDDDVNLKKTFSATRWMRTTHHSLATSLYMRRFYFQHNDHHAAAPLFEKGLTMVPTDGAPFKTAKIARRVMRDQAGISYGIAGDFTKARRIFEKEVGDPDYQCTTT